MRRRVVDPKMAEAIAQLTAVTPDEHRKLADECRAEIARRVLREMERTFESYRFTPSSEADLQEQLLEVLASVKKAKVRSEVRAQNGRYDIEVELLGVRVVLELKVRASAGEVERQAQRYARTDGVHAVAVVTTSNRLAREIMRGSGAVGGRATLGGKPFHVIALRTI